MPCFKQEKKLLKEVNQKTMMMKAEKKVQVNPRVDQKPVDPSLNQSQGQDLKSSVNLILLDQVEQNLRVIWGQTRKKKMILKKME